MTLPRTVADMLTDRVVLEAECMDRMYVNVYVPSLKYADGLVAYMHRQLDLWIASTALLGKITDGFTTAMHRFTRDQMVLWVDLARGRRKDDIAHEYLGGGDGGPRSWHLTWFRPAVGGPIGRLGYRTSSTGGFLLTRNPQQ